MFAKVYILFELYFHMDNLETSEINIKNVFYKFLEASGIFPKLLKFQKCLKSS